MKLRSVYLALAVAGTIVPYLFFFRFLGTEGSTSEFARALFVNGAAGGFSADLLISSFVFWILAFRESRRLGMARPWAYVLLNLLVGLSCALPLFLYFRQVNLQKS